MESRVELFSTAGTIFSRNEEESGKTRDVVMKPAPLSLKTRDVMISPVPLSLKTLAKVSEIKCKVCHEKASINLQLHDLKPNVYVHYLHQGKFRKHNTTYIRRRPAIISEKAR